MVRKSARYLYAALFFVAMAMQVSPAAATLVMVPSYDYTVDGTYTVGKDPAIARSIVTSGNSVSGVDIFTPDFGSFLNILSQGPRCRGSILHHDVGERDRYVQVYFGPPHRD
jgi:hypothetical protein